MSEPREHILSCACELFLLDGLEGFSMRRLAKAVGVTAPALYRHYGSKEEVLQDVVHEAYRRFSRHLYRALEGGTAEERFLLADQGYLEFALESPRLYDVLYVAPDHMGWEELPKVLADQICAIGQFWHDRVRECMDAGILRVGDPRRVATTMWAHSHGLIALYLRGMLRVGEPEFRRLYVLSSRRMMRGVATEMRSGPLRSRSDPDRCA